jgi:hypothetical protein
MRFKFLLILLIGILLCGHITAQGTDGDVLEIKALEFKSFFKNSDFDGASKLFHYPDYYTKGQLHRDMELVGGALRIVFDELGGIENFKKVTRWPSFYHVDVAGGDSKYWKQHPNHIRINFEVEFKEEGLGYFFIYFCKINDIWKISRVSYGLPASKKDSKKRTLEVLRRIGQFVESKAGSKQL